MSADSCESSGFNTLFFFFLNRSFYLPYCLLCLFWLLKLFDCMCIHRPKTMKTTKISTIITSMAATARVTGRTQTQMIRYSLYFTCSFKWSLGLHAIQFISVKIAVVCHLLYHFIKSLTPQVNDEMIQCVICEDWFHTRVSTMKAFPHTLFPSHLQLSLLLSV